MQPVTEAWEQTTRDNFTRPARVTISIDRTDGTSPIVSGSRLISFNFNKSGDCLAGVMTQDTVTFTFDNSDGRFTYDPDNDIYHNAKAVVYCSYMSADYQSYDQIRGGVYYISDIDSSAYKTTFTAKSILAFMKAKYAGFEGNCKDAVIDILSAAEDDKGVPEDEIPYDIDSGLENYNVKILASDNYSYAEALQLIANMCGCVLYVDRYRTICIKKLSTIASNYVISGKISYEFPKVKLAEKIGVINLYYNHGSGHATNAGTARKAGGTQTVTNPILVSDFDALELARYIFDFQQENRKRITGSFRADPRLDLFDIVVVPVGDKVSACALTKINFTYNGAWRGTFEAVEIRNAPLDLRICDLEMLTLEQIDCIQLDKLNPNTVQQINAIENGGQ